MRKNKDKAFLAVVWSSVILTLSCLILLVSFIFINGMGTLSFDFLFSSTDNKSISTTFKANETYDFSFDVTSGDSGTAVDVTEVRTLSTDLVDNEDKKINFVESSALTKIDGQKVENLTAEEATTLTNNLLAPTSDMKVIVTTPGGGIFPLIVTTLVAIFVSLIISVPIGLCAAIYLVEYKINPKMNRLIHFAIDSLAAIPSIIFGLFGFIFFGIVLGLGLSLLSGILTVTIMLLPIIIKTIEEALMSVDDALRESSYGVGATKSQTITKIVLPSALPGIIVAIILSTSRIIGESAIFIFTAGTAARMPNLFQPAGTMTVYAYYVTREYNDIATASAIGIVIIMIVLVLNLSAKHINKKFYNGRS